MGATFWKNIYTKLLTSGGIEFQDGRIKTQGSGSPEGVITATRGSEYTDTSTGLLWNKTTASGNTGWQAGSFAGFTNGSVANPGAYFSSETDVGIYYESGQITFAGDGNALFRINKATGGLASVVDSTVGTDYLSMHPAYFCRAWVNFNGTGTVAIRASGNVSSITDNGIGDYTVNFVTAMPDTNYSPYVSGKRDDNGDTSNFGDIFMFYSLTTSSYRTVNCVAVNGNKQDPSFVSTGVFR